uniref:Uncharacterized protein n=1 Tax=Parastrongyloides trichosuri TaxID=131310 RepID=A0A0N5A004_PARTI
MRIINHNTSNVEHYEWNGQDYYSKNDAIAAVRNFYRGYVIRNESESINGFQKRITVFACNNGTTNFTPISTQKPRGTAKYAPSMRTYPSRTGTTMSRNFGFNNNGGTTRATL